MGGLLSNDGEALLKQLHNKVNTSTIPVKLIILLPLISPPFPPEDKSHDENSQKYSCYDKHYDD